jgi:hypothetical protein
MKLGRAARGTLSRREGGRDFFTKRIIPSAGAERNHFVQENGVFSVGAKYKCFQKKTNFFAFPQLML